jgi:hypothetical protein
MIDDFAASEGTLLAAENVLGRRLSGRVTIRRGRKQGTRIKPSVLHSLATSVVRGLPNYVGPIKNRGPEGNRDYFLVADMLRRDTRALQRDQYFVHMVIRLAGRELDQVGRSHLRSEQSRKPGRRTTRSGESRR